MEKKPTRYNPQHRDTYSCITLLCPSLRVVESLWSHHFFDTPLHINNHKTYVQELESCQLNTSYPAAGRSSSWGFLLVSAASLGGVIDSIIFTTTVQYDGYITSQCWWCKIRRTLHHQNCGTIIPAPGKNSPPTQRRTTRGAEFRNRLPHNSVCRWGRVHVKADGTKEGREYSIRRSIKGTSRILVMENRCEW